MVRSYKFQADKSCQGGYKVQYEYVNGNDSQLAEENLAAGKGVSRILLFYYILLSRMFEESTMVYTAEYHCK
jgi:hypothetical protein